MGCLDNEGVDINLYVSPFSSPVTVLSHRGELNKVTRYSFQHKRSMLSVEVVLFQKT